MCVYVCVFVCVCIYIYSEISGNKKWKKDKYSWFVKYYESGIWTSNVRIPVKRFLNAFSKVFVVSILILK